MPDSLSEAASARPAAGASTGQKILSARAQKHYPIQIQIQIQNQNPNQN
jgi:hypothetical protein